MEQLSGVPIWGGLRDLLINIRSDWSGTNALAYLSGESETKAERFVTMTSVWFILGSSSSLVFISFLRAQTNQIKLFRETFTSP